MLDNRRRYYRHQFGINLCGEISVVEINENKVSSNTALICIKDIGAGGIRFESHLNLPTRPDVVLEVTTVLLGKKLVLLGKISRMIEKLNGCYDYGFQLIEESNDELSKLVNEVSIKARKTLRNTGCSMCSKRTQCHKSNSEFKIPID